MTQAIAESLFYSGGTINTNDIIKTSDECCYDIALNQDHLFIFPKWKTKPVKVVKIERQTEFTYKIMKTKVKIGKRFERIATEHFWRFTFRDVLNNIMKITKGE